jgi:hypothetical protein
MTTAPVDLWGGAGGNPQLSLDSRAIEYIRELLGFGDVMSSELQGDNAPEHSYLPELVTDATFWNPDFSSESAWTEHVPFAFWVINACRPRRIVELGTHTGESYMAFCQAIARIELDATAFAVDTWQGDEHAGFYSSQILDDLRAVHDPQYSEFSQLLQMTFADAAEVIEDGTVDLLHIDGRHFEDDVREDFEQWLPKLSDRGVVLFHDTQVRERGFGVFRVWAEAAERYPSFEFRHGHGLGVLAIGSDAPDPVKALTTLQPGGSDERIVRSLYGQLGSALSTRWHRHTLEVELARQHEVLMLDIEDLRGAITVRDSQLSEVSSDLLRSKEDAKKAQLRSKAELKKARQNLKALQGSTSWKVTRPLRSIRRPSN